ncbi:helix-turn-helix domain-containing protein [Paraburkholderia acidisoli]|uniref:Helix-turn-helix domain-containing protein n=1 Tax=Paraburkholderia acidisoli TaxID=2571748 RepID=A0A7Z2GQ32_9BURK|nr:helix-turn-helix domain-containing protein [Paraburkholderia acidisoli]
MRLLETLGELGGSARLSELADAVGSSRSTVHGVLDTLVEMGYVTRERTRYVLGHRLALAAHPARTRADALRRAFAPALRAFNESCGENCFLTVPGGTRAYLTLDALDGEGRALRLPANARRDALTTSAAGKIFLANDTALATRLRGARRISHALDAELATIGAAGYALDVQASERDLNCVALPLRLRGRVVAALSASGPATRLDPAFMRRLAKRSMRDLFNLVKV